MSLARYTLKRLLMTIPTFLGVTFVVFLLIKLTPGSPIDVLLPPQARTPEAVAVLERRLGLNEPLHVQYWRWLSSALQGDLGRSYVSQEPVLNLLIGRIWPTIQLAIVAMVVALCIAIPAGVLSAVYRDTWVDHVSRVVAFLGISIPSFWLGIMIILIFSLFWAGWFGQPLIPSGGYTSPSEGLIDYFRSVLPPGITLGVAFAAITTRLTRSAMVEVLNEEYVKTARSKGVKEKAVVVVHAFRNGLIPVVTVLGMQVGYLLNGAIVVEQVFRWPGMGQLLFRAVTERDLPLIQATVLFIALVFIASNFVVDLLYSFLDPRIRYD